MKLIYVTDVYGRKARINQDDLDGTKILIPLYNQFGTKLSANPKRLKQGEYTHIHRENIAPSK
jgi:hypothetical protein